MSAGRVTSAGVSPASREGRAVYSGVLLFFLLGFISLAVQTVLIREALFAFHGGEIGLGLFFAFWLGAIAVGASGGVRASGRISLSTHSASGGFALGLSLLPLAGILQVALFRYHRLLLPVEAGGYLPVHEYLALLAVAVAPAALITGFTFPLGLRAWRISAGAAYASEALGSMAGGAFAALYALSRMPAASLIALTAPFALAGIAFTWGRTLDHAARWQKASAAIILALTTIGLVTGGSARIDRALLRARWDGLATGTQPIRFLDTPYNHVTLGERGGERSLYIDGLYHGAVSDPYVDSLAAAIVATQHPDPREMVVIAPALSGPVRVLAAARGAEMKLVRGDGALDRLLADIAPRDDPAASTSGHGASGDAHANDRRRIVLVTDDPRAAVRRMGAHPAVKGMGACPDLIAVLQGGPMGGAENRLYTREFFGCCARALAPGGVLVLDLPGAANVATPEAGRLQASVVAALQDEFTDVRVAPGLTQYVFAARPVARTGENSAPTNARVVEDPLTWNPDTLAARRADLWPGGSAWPPEIFAQLFPPERVAALEASLSRSLNAGVRANEDGYPIVYYEQLMRWDRISGSGLASILDTWRRWPWIANAAFLALLALAALALRRRGGQALVSLATTGMAGMGADLLALLLYQTHLGTLYLRVGLVVAVYMSGLAAGAWIGSRVHPNRSRAAIAVSDITWIVFLIGWLALLGWLSGIAGHAASALLLALALIAGALTALPFQWVASDLARGNGSDRARAVAGGLADAADNAGALLGGLIAGTFLIPLLGFAGALLFLAALKLLAALGWLLPERPAAAIAVAR